MTIFNLILINFIGIEALIKITSESENFTESVKCGLVIIFSAVFATVLDFVASGFYQESQAIFVILLESYIAYYLCRRFFKIRNNFNSLIFNTYVCAVVANLHAVNYGIAKILFLAISSGIMFLLLIVILKLINMKILMATSCKLAQVLVLAGLLSIIYSSFRLWYIF